MPAGLTRASSLRKLEQLSRIEFFFDIHRGKRLATLRHSDHTRTASPATSLVL